VDQAVDYLRTQGKPAYRQARRKVSEWARAGLSWDQIQQRIDRGDHLPHIPL
jgi:hypothetical protein